MPSQLAASGLNEARFRGCNTKGSWATLPGVALNLALRSQVVQPYAQAVVAAAYNSDAAVAGDTALQGLSAALCSPKGANLGRINAGGCELATRAQLASFVEDFVTIVLTHGTAHLQDFSMRMLNVALMPPRLGKQSAPRPNRRYSEAEMLHWVPTTGTAARQYTFVANFVGTTMLPITNLGGCCSRGGLGFVVWRPG